MKRYALAMIAALALGGCSMGQDLSSGGAAVDDFPSSSSTPASSRRSNPPAGPEIKATAGGFAPSSTRSTGGWAT